MSEQVLLPSFADVRACNLWKKIPREQRLVIETANGSTRSWTTAPGSVLDFGDVLLTPEQPPPLLQQHGHQGPTDISQYSFPWWEITMCFEFQWLYRTHYRQMLLWVWPSTNALIHFSLTMLKIQSTPFTNGSTVVLFCKLFVPLWNAASTNIDKTNLIREFSKTVLFGGLKRNA